MGGAAINRMTDAMIDIRNIERLPRPKPVLARMIATKALAKAFYGTETTQPRQKYLTTIAAACASAVVGKQTQRAPELATALTAAGRTEVHAYMMLRRWKLLRRMWHSRWAWKEKSNNF